MNINYSMFLASSYKGAPGMLKADVMLLVPIYH